MQWKEDKLKVFSLNTGAVSIDKVPGRSLQNQRRGEVYGAKVVGQSGGEGTWPKQKYGWKEEGKGSFPWKRGTTKLTVKPKVRDAKKTAQTPHASRWIRCSDQIPGLIKKIDQFRN